MRRRMGGKKQTYKKFHSKPLVPPLVWYKKVLGIHPHI
jgi:hypothetical protein